MAEVKVDSEFVRKTWEDPAHLSDYVDAVGGVGLWNSERHLVSRYFNKEDRILDIGCGAGRTTIALYRHGYVNVLGVDLSEAMIAQAISLSERAGYAIPFEVGDATDLQYGDETFDSMLFTAQGLMCIPGGSNRLQALREAGRVLRPGGFFMFTTHDRHAALEFASFWKDEKARWEKGTQDRRLLDFGDRIVMDSGALTFLHFPTRDEVAKVVKESGLVVVAHTMRSELGREHVAARKYSSDCRMWVVQRPMTSRR